LSPTVYRKEKVDNSKHLMMAMQIQKEVKSNPKNPAIKKCAGLKKAFVEKDVKSKVAAKKWL